MKKFIFNHKISAFIYIILLISACCYLLLRLFQGISLETSILKLLPHKETLTVQHLVDTITNTNSKKVLFIIGGNTLNIDQSISVADNFYLQLQSSHLFSDIRYQIPVQKIQQAFQQLAQSQLYLLEDNDRKQLSSSLLTGNYTKLTTNAKQQLYNPLTPLSHLPSDPLFLFQNYLTRLMALSSNHSKVNIIKNRMQITDSKASYILIYAQLKDNPLQYKTQQRFSQLYQQLLFTIKAYPDVTLKCTGMIRHAIYGMQSAKQEISVIGLGSLLGIFCLLLGVFRSMQPLGYSLLAIAVGIVSGFAACLLIYPHPHILTLVLSASLIGLSIDYSLHYFTEYYYQPRSHIHLLTMIKPAIQLGLITSLIAYAALGMSFLPLFQQMAVFSFVGLSCAYFCVIYCFHLFSDPHPHPLPSYFEKYSQYYLALWSNKKWFCSIGIVLLLIFILTGIAQLTINNDIRTFQYRSPELQQQERYLQTFLPQESLALQYLVILADNNEIALQQEEILRPYLDDLIQQGALQHYHALSQILPSQARQQQNAYLLTTLIKKASHPDLSEYLNTIGLTLKLPKNQQLLTLEKLPQHPLYLQYKDIILPSYKNKSMTIIALQGVNNRSIKVLNHLSTQSVNDSTKVLYLNYSQRISNVLTHYHHIVIQLVICSYMIIAILLGIKYPLRKGLFILLPPLFAAGFALAILVYTGGTLNLFNTMALVLVLGIGIDYTLFFAEKEQHHSMTFLAITLSAITTILSFGLLALSNTPIIRSFGIIVFAGIFAAAILSPLVQFHHSSINK